MNNRKLNSKTLTGFISTIIAVSVLISTSGCSEEDRQTLSSIATIAENADQFENATPSTFEENCIEPLGSIFEKQQNEQITLSDGDQQRAVKMLERCNNEVQKEIDITYDEFEDINELPKCKELLTTIIQFKSEFDQKIADFAALPNSSENEKRKVSALFSTLTLEMIGTGGGAAVNRIGVCIVERVTPELLEEK